MYQITVPEDIKAKYDRIWVPHPGPQTEVLMRNEFEILYGGARGGGKTDAGIVWLTDHVDNPRYRALIIRKNADDLADWIDRARYWYEPMGATFAYKPAVITWPSGAVFRTGHLKDADSYTKYQGHEYQRELIEEATQIPDEKRYIQLIGSCRSTVDGIKPQILLTANPGNVGHAWVKQRFIDPAPPGEPFTITDQDTGSQSRSRIFIPSTIDNNPTLQAKDPEYVKYLDSIKNTDENLWRAWRYGDWSIFVGQVFSNFRPDTHIIKKLPVPLKDCKKIIGFDWGYNAPGAAVFVAVTPENQWGVKHYYVYREIYQNKTTPEDWAKQIKMFAEIDEIDYMVLPHDCYDDKYGVLTIEKTLKEICVDRKGNPLLKFIRGNSGTRASRHQSVAIMQELLTASESEPVSKRHPRLQFLERNREILRTLPLLVYDENDIEDIDTDGEDHLYDALTLALKREYEFGGGAVLNSKLKHRIPISRTFTQNTQGETTFPDILEATKKDLQKRR